MSYERLSHSQGLRALRDSDVSEYHQYSLTVTISHGDIATWSVTTRTLGKGSVDDRRLIVGTFNYKETSPLMPGLLGLFRAALEGAQRRS